MLTILDRYILRALLINYGIALAVMVSLYVVLDLFVNMDEFTEGDQGVAEVAADVIGYYATNLTGTLNLLEQCREHGVGKPVTRQP